jgi:hypothetical protein
VVSLVMFSGGLTMMSKKIFWLPLIIGGLILVLASTMIRTPRLAQAALESNLVQTSADSEVFLPLILSNSSDPLRKFIQHEGMLLSYEGAATCIACHEEETHDFATSNHYLWEGKFDSINDFCSYPDINFGPGKLTTVNNTQVDGGCAICHAGLGELPKPENPENADCLMCHAEEYRRTAVNLGGVWRFRPDFDQMPTTITLQEEPTQKSCLTCHTYAGGGQNNKRGDISDTLINPTQDQDIHMSQGLTCVDCHRTNDSHQIAGRGVDLRIDEGVAMASCTSCHNPTDDHGGNLRRHLDTVACQSCHIPEFARAFSTDMLRDFRAVEVNPKGLYEPAITHQSNVVPEYAFWNGKSGFYEFGANASPGQALAWPLGDINDGMLTPFKLHKAVQPQDPLTGAILPVKTGILFQTGNMDLAIQVGAQEAGFNLIQGYTFVDTQRWMGIFHEMPSADSALACADCHDDQDRIDFDALGYTPKSTRESKPLCTSCHEPEEPKNFYELHEIHIEEENVTCGECHFFTR